MPAVTNFLYPDSVEIEEIVQDLIPAMESDDPVFFQELFPTENGDTWKLEWEQWDNMYGLQQARGLDGQPTRVPRLGSNRFSTEPGVYSEFVDFDEAELTRRGEFAKFSGHVDVNQMAVMHTRWLMQRRVDRQRYLGWTLLTTGQFLVPSPNLGYEHRDSYTFRQFTASPGFSDATNSTPFSFFLGLNTVGRGTSSSYGSDATVYVNATTAARILNNRNQNDLGGRYKINGGDTVNDLVNTNMILKARGLPSIAIYDKGYSTTADTIGSYVPFIPNGIGVMVGKRPGGQSVGKYRMGLNAFNGFQPGPYTRIINTFTSADVAPGKAVLQVHDGHNGGPYIQFPSAVIILNLG